MTRPEIESFLRQFLRDLHVPQSKAVEIQDELLAHLEDRVDDLCGAGQPETTAVHLAIAELGNPSELAQQLNHISRGKLRRWVMRASVGAVAALVLIGLGLSAFWSPDPRVGPAQAVAQSGPPGTEKKEASKEPETAKSKIEKALASRIAINVDGSPLVKFLEQLRQEANIQVHFKQQRVVESEPESVLETPIHLSLDDVSVEMILDLALEQVSTNIGFYHRDDVLVVTTTEDLQASFETKVYNCRDLLQGVGMRHARTAGDNTGVVSASGSGVAPYGIGSGGGGAAPPGASGGFYGGGGGNQPNLTNGPEDDLISSIETTILPESWSNAGGDASISYFDGLLIINNTAKAHRQIENLLREIRTASHKLPSKSTEGRDANDGATSRSSTK